MQMPFSSSRSVPHSRPWEAHKSCWRMALRLRTSFGRSAVRPRWGRTQLSWEPDCRSKPSRGIRARPLPAEHLPAMPRLRWTPIPLRAPKYAALVRGPAWVRVHERAGPVVENSDPVRRNFNMLSRFQSLCSGVTAMRLAIVAVLCSVGTLAAAQDQPAPKWEVFGGYSFLYPNADLHAMFPGGLLPVSSPLESNPRGLGGSLTYDFNRWFGLTLDGSTHWGSGESSLGKKVDDAAFTNISFGPKVTFRRPHVAPFLEALVGDHRLTPDAFHDINKLGLMIGGGLDFKVSKHVALRLPRVDYVMSSYRYGPSALTGSTDLRGVRAQAGLVFTWGGEHEVKPPRAPCSIQPDEVFAGEPVSATAEGSNFNPKRTVTYQWSGSGVRPGETGTS